MIIRSIILTFRCIEAMQKKPFINLEIVRRNFNFLIEYGVPKTVIENALKISKDELANDNVIISAQNVFSMLRKGFEHIGPDMIIKIGAMAPIEIMGVLGQIMKNCQTLGEAVIQFIRFQNLFFGISQFKIMAKGNCFALVHKIDYPFSEDDKQLLNELNLSACVSIGRMLLLTEFVPKEVWFSHKKTDYADIYKQHFRCPVKFNQEENAIIIDKRVTETIIPGSYPYMKNILVEYAEGLSAKLETGKLFQDDVKRIIVDLLPKGCVDIESVSEKLNMSRWTLTRNLKKEGSTFKFLLTDFRKELSITYLRNKKLSVIEIAFLLGYSEASAFQRAFKSWTGKNPYQYRQS